MTCYSISDAPISGPDFKVLDEAPNRFVLGFSFGFPVAEPLFLPRVVRDSQGQLVATPPEPHVLPKVLQQKNKRPLNDVMFGGGSTIVSRKFREAVEEFDHGQHQFFPVSLLQKDGSPHDGDWFFLNIVGRIPCLIPKGPLKTGWSKYPRTRAHYLNNGLNEPRYDSLDPDTCMVSRPAVAGRHLWQSWIFSNPTWICSAPLFQRLKEVCRSGRADGDHWDILGLWINPIDETDEPWDAKKYAKPWIEWALSYPEEVELLGYQRFL